MYNDWHLEHLGSRNVGGTGLMITESASVSPLARSTKNDVGIWKDERKKDENYNQLLAHKVSPDGGKTWGYQVDNVAFPDKVLRPEMPIVTKLPNDKYVMIYEIVVLPNNPVCFRYSDNGCDWENPEDIQHKILDDKGNFKFENLCIVWTPKGGENGTLMSDIGWKYKP